MLVSVSLPEGTRSLDGTKQFERLKSYVFSIVF
jgi:hypothetical protein